jgi:hypothetical protein
MVYYYTYTTSQSDGNYSYTAYCNDSAGNSVSTETRHITFDTIAPSFEIISPIHMQSYSDGNVSINLSALDEDLDKIWFFNGTENITYTDSSTILLEDAWHRFTFYANDSAGNINSTEIIFRVSADYPIPTINSPLDRTFYGSNYLIINYTCSGELANTWITLTAQIILK